MHKEQEFDSSVKKALEKECCDISASEELKRRIDEAVCEWQEGNSMKHINKKKLGVMMAAACLLVSGLTVFAGRTANIRVGGSAAPEYTEYADLEKAEEQLGYTADSVEQFANGYSFADININELEACDEEDNKLYTIPTMMLRYTKDGSDISLYIQQKIEELTISKEPDASRNCGDVTLRYDEYTYKFVPASYELTQEDIINKQKDNYMISYGSDEVTIQKVMDVRWEKNGISYEMLGFDLELTGEEMLDMAEEIVLSN